MKYQAYLVILRTHVFINFVTVVTTPVIQNTQYEVPGWSCYPQNTCLYQLWHRSHNSSNAKHTVWSTRLILLSPEHMSLSTWHSSQNSCDTKHTDWEWSARLILLSSGHMSLSTLTQQSQLLKNKTHSMKYQAYLDILRTHVFINFDTAVTTPEKQNTQYEVPGLSWYSQDTCLYQLWHSSHNSWKTNHTVWSTRLILIFSGHMSLSTLTQQSQLLLYKTHRMKYQADLVILSTHVFINLDTVVTSPVIEKSRKYHADLLILRTRLYQLWHSSHNSCKTKYTIWSIRLILLFSKHMSLSTMTQ